MRKSTLIIAAVVLSVLAQPALAKKKHSSEKSEQTQQQSSDTMSPGGHVQPSHQMDPNEKVIHLLNRITFGPRPGDIEEVQKMGVDAFIRQQLHPESLEEAPKVKVFLFNSPALHDTPDQLYNDFGPPAVNAAKMEQGLGNDKEDKKKVNKLKNELANKVTDDVVQARLMRALESPRQLQEVMTDFWFNHFNVFAKKGQDKIFLGAYEEQAIRPYALGKFRDLLGATCHHAGMLFYLDNWQNSAPGSGRGRFSGLNENYARELMELHTLGVDGGYTQKDVTELARVLTGLGLPKRNGKDGTLRSASNAFGSYFDSKRHDYGDKVVLGHTIHGTGENEIDAALDMLSAEPATAHHICYQLAQYFVCDNPPEELVKRLSAKFSSSGGDIKEVLSTLFRSSEFWDEKYEAAKFKSPFRYVISSLRALDAEPNNYARVEQYLNGQGMPLYGCLTPDGYKNTKIAWLNPDALVRRCTFATNITSGRFKGVRVTAPSFEQLENTVGLKLSDDTKNAIAQAPDQLKTGLILGSPEFMLY